MTLDRRALLAAPAALAGCAASRTPAPLLVDIDRAPDEIIPLWPDAPPGGENVTITEAEVARENPFGLVDRAAHNVTHPTLARFAAREPTGAALLIIPGGGYSWVVIDKEGFEGARWFSRRGVTCYVLRHRLPHQGWAARADAPLQDAQRAMRLIRARAVQDGIDASPIAAMGFSAGGHVAGSLAARYDARVYASADAIDEFSARPDLSALVYPVITMRAPHAHAGSRRNLLGEAPSEEAIAAYSLETAPPARTPPSFLLHAADDPAVPVENTLGYFSALRRAGVAAEMHVFERGGHGFGLRGLEQNTARAWPELFLAWANAHGFGAR